MQYEFIESSAFTKVLYDYLSEDDYTEFQQFLLEQPEAGAVVKGSGGVRKVRWARSGAGRSRVVCGCAITRATQRGRCCYWLFTPRACGSAYRAPY